MVKSSAVKYEVAVEGQVMWYGNQNTFDLRVLQPQLSYIDQAVETVGNGDHMADRTSRTILPLTEVIV